MKFAKELEEELVPEWRIKYFNYKQGKKKIKSITRAIQLAQKSPRTPLRRTLTPKSRLPVTEYFRWTPSKLGQQPETDASASDRDDNESRSNLSSRRQSNDIENLNPRASITSASPIRIPQAANEQQPLAEDGIAELGGSYRTRYGSIIGSPPSPPLSRPATLTLPAPAIDPATESDITKGPQRSNSTASQPPFPTDSTPANQGSAFEVGKTRHPTRGRGSITTRQLSLPSPRSLQSHQRGHEAPLLKRLFSHGRKKGSKSQRLPDVPLEALQEIDSKQTEFYAFLDKEFDKIESFYKSKEEESAVRLEALKEQLHALRDQGEESARERAKQKAEKKKQSNKTGNNENGHHNGREHSLYANVLQNPIKAAKKVHFGKWPSHAGLATPLNNARDAAGNDVDWPDYKTAKKKLRLALQEFYRSLELIKAYAISNRTAFRKINKKYDKAVHSRNTMRYMNEKVNNAWFVKSTVIDDYITAVEDLYARYFERGSHKLAVGKLRRKLQKPGALDGSVFRCGIALAAAAVFGFEGLVKGADIFYAAENVNPVLSQRTSLLLQFYGAYFMLVFLFLFFCVDCYVFNRAKVNYVFIFEFDTRHNLDWRQLSEIPCFFAFLLGLTLWLNFSVAGGAIMYLWWPVILVCFTVLIMFLPLPILYHKSRRWFIISCARLFVAGLVPVEFRDFFLGDMFCSETYTFGGVELFLCTYARDWQDPKQCSSSNSRVLGFLTTLPGIMRMLQCFRRYKDTRNIFPHLVNAGKYSFTILQYLSLSVFRINENAQTRAFFVTCGTINAVYCSIWDIVMDWSLLDFEAEHRFLRPQLAYKPRYYYAAMIIDPILRFNWVFYAIPYFQHEIQHSALLGFLVSLSEVIRRGIWTIFRVENEHSSNVGRFRASRDVELPYSSRSPAAASLDYSRRNNRKDSTSTKARAYENFQNGDGTGDETDAQRTTPNLLARETSDPEAGITHAVASGSKLHRAETRESAMSSLRRRQRRSSTENTPSMSIGARVGSILHGAHAQDFERRNKDDAEPDDDDDEDDDVGSDSDSDDDDDDDDEGQDIGNNVEESEHPPNAADSVSAGSADAGGSGSGGHNNVARHGEGVSSDRQ